MPGRFAQLYVHLVWATWDRLPTITSQLAPPLSAALTHKCGELHCRCMAVGGVEDHVHVLVQFSPSISIAQLVLQPYLLAGWGGAPV